MKDYYEILGVARNASQKEVKEVYRKLAFQYHPDQNRANSAAVERMKEINEAYAVLSDPTKRKEYDRLKEAYGPTAYDRFRKTYSDEDIFRGSDLNQVFEEMARAFGFRGFDKIFEESYGQAYRTFEFRRPGLFGKGFIFFGPVHGGERRRMGQPEEVPAFRIPGLNPGKISRYLLNKVLGIEERQKGKDRYDAITLNPQDAQEGGKLKYPHRRRSKELAITIPPGIKEGQKIRLKGMGDEGKGGGEPGDLYITIKYKRSLVQRVQDFLKGI